VHFRSDRQRKAVFAQLGGCAGSQTSVKSSDFASLGNRFSLSNSGVSTGSGIADALVNLYPDERSHVVLNSDGKLNSIDTGSSIANALVGLYPDGIQSSKGSVGNAIVKMWPGGDSPKEELYTLYYPSDLFSEQEVLAAREEFDFPMAWIVTREGSNYKLVLDPNLVKKYYGGATL
jgi:hypothetical protein